MLHERVDVRIIRTWNLKVRDVYLYVCMSFICVMSGERGEGGRMQLNYGRLVERFNFFIGGVGRG